MVNATEKYRAFLKQLDDDYSTWKSHYKDLSAYILPRHGKYLYTEQESKQDEGKKKHQKIINGCATDALRIQTCGIHGGMTPASKPWFTLTLQDNELAKYDPVREWLHIVTDGMLNIFNRSNFYETAFSIYTELGCFGTAANLIEEDYQTVIRCRPFTVGEYRIALDKNLRPVILYRQFNMKARQMIDQFGEENCSQSVRTAAKNKQTEQSFEVIHCIQPSNTLDPDSKSTMPFESLYFEKDNNQNNFLRKRGYNEQPFSVTRWDVNGVNTYGDSYAMDALGNIKMLQTMEKDKLLALKKMIDPPLNVPNELKNIGANIVPGGINYYDAMRGNPGITPIYHFVPNIEQMGIEIQRVELAIRRSFFNDLFISILGSDKRMTAFEVAERHEEKLVLLGPVILRIESDFLDPTIKRTFAIMDRLGMLPEMPPEMRGYEIKIEYISLLAQAQRMVGTASIAQLASFVSAIAPVIPDVVDKFDADEAVDEYGQMLGVPPKVVRSDDWVAEIRAERMKQLQAQVMAEQMAQGAQTGKALSETKMDQNSALDALIGSLGEAT